MTLSGPDFVARQYRDATNLGARIALHRPFSLENGAAQLSRRFSEVSLRRHGGALLVTEAGPLLEYLLSGATADAAAGVPEAKFRLRVAALEALVRRELDLRGAIRVTTNPGLFVARR